jgi:prepilin-type N-terminal cleavage/methylation domain-containing protein
MDLIKRLKNQNSGFSLVELISTTAIIAIISVLFLGGFIGSSRSAEVSMGTLELASEIRSVQNDALSSRLAENGERPLGGWGIVFSTTNPDSFTVFADRNGDGIHNGASEQSTVKQIGRGARITGLEVDGNPVNHARILFIPPEPKIKIYDASPASDYSSLTIELTDVTGQISRSIILNKFGLIDVENE